MPPTNIALAGATGNLGPTLLAALLSAGHTVLILSRSSPSPSTSPTPTPFPFPPHPNLSYAHISYSNIPSLTRTLTKNAINVVISALSTPAIPLQKPLIHAAALAGITHFIPAEFGMDSTNPLARGLPVVCAAKAEIQALLSATAAKVPGFTWTGIACGAFLDWGLRAGFILDVARRRAVLYGNGNGETGEDGRAYGDVAFSATTLEDISRAVVAVVERGERGFDRVVKVHSAVVTQGQLMKYAGGEWEVKKRDTEEVMQDSLKVLGKMDGGEEVDNAILNLCAVGTWGAGYGGHFTSTDNESLGIDVLSEEEVRSVVEGCCY